MSSDRQLGKVGNMLATYLQAPVQGPPTSPPTPRKLLESTLKPGDVLLQEGRQRISTAIKYLTQSSWSHAALYVGQDFLIKAKENGIIPESYQINKNDCFIEADLQAGVRVTPLEQYLYHHTRICRPVGLEKEGVEKLSTYMVERIGYKYDLRNIIDLARYLMPTPPVPIRFRRKLLTLGSGDPTKAICSTLIAQAFQSISYPILPSIAYQSNSTIDGKELSPIYHRRHYSLCTPRDFDVSPYFAIVKPTLIHSFDYQKMKWEPFHD